MHILKKRVFRDSYLTVTVNLCSDIWCLFLLLPELHAGFKKDARTAKNFSLAPQLSLITMDVSPSSREESAVWTEKRGEEWEEAS